ncbi:hypothetical protein [Undibacterium curvum]|uniref:Uncharacterized protein n=1 Tax=Undibacterium curvum TaxID=2762294 RepID=A0ABR7A0C2_9BURK|nr:hypothetical protein [Undibacterium curvum]MBC3930365.1 hypothetical protein [Undibacterium curvum]
MKQGELIMLGLTLAAVGGAAWWFFWRDSTDKPVEIETGKKGWQVFSDGTEIDPKGNYYLNGKLIWSAP